MRGGISTLDCVCREDEAFAERTFLASALMKMDALVRAHGTSLEAGLLTLIYLAKVGARVCIFRQT